MPRDEDYIDLRGRGDIGEDLFHGPTGYVLPSEPQGVPAYGVEGLINQYLELYAGREDLGPGNASSTVYENEPLTRYDSLELGNQMSAISNDPMKWAKFRYTHSSTAEDVNGWTLPTTRQSYWDTREGTRKFYPAGVMRERVTYHPELMTHSPSGGATVTPEGVFDFSGTGSDVPDMPSDEDIAMHIATQSPVYTKMLPEMSPDEKMISDKLAQMERLRVQYEEMEPEDYYKMGWLTPEAIATDPNRYVKSGWVTQEQVDRIMPWASFQNEITKAYMKASGILKEKSPL